MEKGNVKILILNMVIPIILGTIIYYLISPEVIFVKLIDNLFGMNFHISGLDMEHPILQFLRNHFLDMLWGYALVFAMFLILGNNTADIRKSFIIAFSFSTIMELLQITPIAKGTFDILDIMFEFLAEVVAVFIIKIILMRRKRK